jgi:peptidoglycan/LPS O-acetylase OafA/YrhL
LASVAGIESPALFEKGSPTAASAKLSRFYRPELDTLRFLAFLGVFTFHVAPRDPSFYAEHHLLPHLLIAPVCALAGAGAFGVDLFFALSAYLITVLLLREKDVTGTIDLKGFYIRRVLRIWPLYFFFLAAAACISLWDRSQGLQWPFVTGYLLLAGNWVYTWKGLPQATIVIPLWSISVEEQFYLLWPLVARRLSPGQWKYAILGLFSMGYISRVAVVSLGMTGAAAEYNTFVRMDAIVFGIALAVMLRDRPVRLSLASRFGLASLCLGVWCAVSLYAGLNAPRAAAPLLGTIVGRPAVAIAAAGLLLAVIGAPAAGAKFLSHPLLTYLGRISYGLYVYHMTGLMFAHHLFSNETAIGRVERAILGLLLTVLFSAISYRWLDSPFLRLKDRFATILARPV